MAKKWIVKKLTYERPGKASWKEIREFNTPGEADDWLCSYLRTNKLNNEDYLIKCLER